MARVLRASRRSSAADGILTKEEQQTVMAAPLSCQDYDSADRIILLLSQTDIREVLEGRTRLRKKPGSCDFSSMQPSKEEGIWYTRGRLGQALKRILGPDKLPILSSSSRLAFLQMEEAHCQNHMAGGDTLFRSRCLSWIVRGRTLADRLARNCLTCIFKRKKLALPTNMEAPSISRQNRCTLRQMPSKQSSNCGLWNATKLQNSFQALQ